MVQINIDSGKIADFCKRWKITEFALFGSVLREDFRPDSDVDVMVSFAENAEWSLFDWVKMQDDLKEVMGRNVDIASRRGIEMGRNPIRKKSILSSTEIIYESRP